MRELTGLNVSGAIKDIIRHSDGRIEEREWDHNLVVTSVLKLITSLLKGDSTGIKYWAVGGGQSSWDTSTVNPTLGETQLTAELGRKLISPANITFVDDNGSVSVNPTNKLHITLTFSESECNGVWREFAIFGGNATASPNSGTMINKKHHSILTKTSAMSVERHMVFTFNLS